MVKQYGQKTIKFISRKICRLCENDKVRVVTTNKSCSMLNERLTVINWHSTINQNSLFIKESPSRGIVPYCSAFK